MKTVIAICVSKTLNGQFHLVQFTVEGTNGGHQLYLTKEEAKQFEIGDQYKITFDKA